jgi:hypothetical protein
MATAQPLSSPVPMGTTTIPFPPNDVSIAPTAACQLLLLKQTPAETPIGHSPLPQPDKITATQKMKVKFK